MKVFRLDNNKYVLIINKTEYEGTKNDIIKVMLKLGVEEQEICMGFTELEDNDIADYGINWKFIFAKKVA